MGEKICRTEIRNLNWLVAVVQAAEENYNFCQPGCRKIINCNIFLKLLNNNLYADLEIDNQINERAANSKRQSPRALESSDGATSTSRLRKHTD